MSIKIYEAYRIPRKNLNEFLPLMRKATIEAVRERAEIILLNAQMPFFNKKVAKLERDTRKKHGELPDFFVEAGDYYIKREIWNYFEERTKKASMSPLRSYFDLDSSANVWIDGRYTYIIPYGLTTMPDVDYLEDYRYFNNTDRPEDMTAAQWGARYRKWNKLALDDHNATRLVYDIISMSTPMDHERWSWSISSSRILRWSITYYRGKKMLEKGTRVRFWARLYSQKVTPAAFWRCTGQPPLKHVTWIDTEKLAPFVPKEGSNSKIVRILKRRAYYDGDVQDFLLGVMVGYTTRSSGIIRSYKYDRWLDAIITKEVMMIAPLEVQSSRYDMELRKSVPLNRREPKRYLTPIAVLPDDVELV